MLKNKFDIVIFIINLKRMNHDHHELPNEYALHNYFVFLPNINCQGQLETIQQTEKKKNVLSSREFASCH